MEPIDHKKTIALLIGVSEFPNDKAKTPLKPIPNIKVNIEQLKTVLTDTSIVGIPAENIIVSFNETRDQIVSRLYSLKRLTQDSSSNLLIYYAGHGYPEYFGQDFNVYLTTFSTNTEEIENGAISIEAFTKYIKQSNAERKFIILDACYSGEIHAIGAMGDVESQIKTELNKFKGSFVITSASKDNPSRFPSDKTNEPTYFTAEFLNVLKTGIEEKNELLSTKDIFLSIEQNLLRKKLPEPQTSTFQNADQILFARNQAYHELSAEKLESNKIIFKRIYKSFYQDKRYISSSEQKFLNERQKELELNDNMVDEIQQAVIEELRKEQEAELRLKLKEEQKQKEKQELKLKKEKERIVKEQAELKLRQEEERKQKEQQELKLKQEEERIAKEQAELKRKQEERIAKEQAELKRKQEEERIAKEQAEVKLRQEEERKLKEQQELKRKQEEERIAKEQAELKLMQEEELKLKELEDLKRKQEEERIAKEQAELKLRQEEALKLKEQEDLKRKQEEKRLAEEQAELKLRQEEALKLKEQEDLKRKQEEERLAKEQAELKLRQEEERKIKKQEDLKRKQEEERLAKEQAELKLRQEEERKLKERHELKLKVEEEFKSSIKKIEIILNNSEPEMIFVEGGMFQMGSEKGNDDEKPVHTVILDSFYICKYLITQKQWLEIMGKNPSKFKVSDNCPVEKVSWNDIKDFIKKLNAKANKKYRLPTEAEWEYAARGGNQTRAYEYAGSNIINEVAWYYGNSGDQTHQVGQKKPNEIGLYDMSGNVWEWCNDWYLENYYKKSPQDNPEGPSNGLYRVLRGGSWNYTPSFCRVTNRLNESPDIRIENLGFRLVLDP